MPTLRERQRASTREEIATAALTLFVAQGFTATTVDQIAKAANVSRRTFFHYFATKEDAALGDDELGERLRVRLVARPADESAWSALTEALRLLQEDIPQATQLALAELYAATPSLRARHLEKNLRWQELLAPEIARRLGIDTVDHRARALIAAALACLDVAVEAWRVSGGRSDIEALYLDATSAVRT